MAQLVLKIGMYLLAAGVICLWIYGQYRRGKEFYDRDRKSGVQRLLSDDKEN
jgi:hypothetical protein